MGNDAVWRNPAKGLRVCNGSPLKGLRVRSHLKRLGVLKEEETGINFSYFDNRASCRRARGKIGR